MYQGKLGIKLGIDFIQSELNFVIYIEYLSVAFKFYIEINMRILIVKINPSIYFEIKVRGEYEEFPLICNLKDDANCYYSL